MNVPLLVLHIAGGAGGVLTGAAALTLKKGGPAHKKIGTLFFASMMLMAADGAALAVVKPDRITAGTGFFTFYLIVTSWLAARGDGKAGRPEQVGLLAACACTTAYLVFGVQGLSTPNGRVDNLPGAIAFVFAAVAGLAAALDLNFILRGTLSACQRITRHLWRMCTALLIAAMSFFLGQQKVMPVVVRGSMLLFLPEVAVIAAMTFWIARTRFPRFLRLLARPMPRSPTLPVRP